MRFSFLFRCRVNRRTGSREGVIGGRPTRIPWSWTPPALASSRAPHRRAPGFRSSAVVVGMLGLSPCRRTREGPVQKEAPHPLDAQLTIRRVISEVGPPPGSSGLSQGRVRLRSGMSPTEVGYVRLFRHFRCARCHFSPPTGAGHVLKVSRAWLFSAIQKVCGPGCRAPVDIEETPVGYGIVQTLDLRRDTPHPGTRWITRGRAAPGPRKERGASPASDGSSRSGEIDRCSCRGGG